MMNSKTFHSCLLVSMFVLPGFASAQSVPLIINEYNAVGGSKYLDTDNYGGTSVSSRNEKEDKYFATFAELQVPANSPEGVAEGTPDGRIQGNGDDWIELVVTMDHVDIRGWSLEWSEAYTIENSQAGTGGRRGGFIQFADDLLWSDLRAGTIITISEEDTIWVDTDYIENDRNFTDGITAENGGDYKIDLDTDTSFNPVLGDWWIHVSTEDEANNDTPLITTSLSNIDNGDFVPDVGEEFESGDFSVTNDAWQVTILDNNATPVIGPLGEEVAENLLWGGGGISSREVARLQVDPTSDYSTLNFGAYEDGETSTFGQPNLWNDLGDTQDFTALRSWFTGSVDGDYNQDGVVDLADYTVWRDNLGSTTNLAADGNGDNVVDAADYMYWKERFGTGFTTPAGLSSMTSAVGASQVPEPSSLLLGLLATTVLWRARR
ncbi:dockerin type I domain-containing protein [Aeoliella mucimassa]|uniref:PEP-CTERM protein-sorting domain-containing protein n=1 Tax=Aeoliella mucimassa TaxID=2527972 RepID=A0A518AGZ2_9BACT|nr:dockerin type I domain-containing protein [Aeoliella mucimassa]QDU53972.1 hypothetical protein Pan181_01510 [Aeoliella mucimassa]